VSIGAPQAIRSAGIDAIDACPAEPRGDVNGSTCTPSTPSIALRDLQ
jgi:hypothetical protein